jgi:hypothetical protein
LRLVDEITIHGGINDPFFTFGGGTVLMLRHQHRLSKDIDFFVPDPQSLGYVTPRLSDVAEELCRSQYQESANFIKLHLEEGEIDFVASPNLLNDNLAYERWELFGRSVRVETTAEIIAKKMYHRGDQATGRDLFDLVMAIECESGALADAERFMYRYLAQICVELAGSSGLLRAQFAAVQTLTYSPTFTHAAEVVDNYLAGLIQTHERSLMASAEFAANNGLAVIDVDNKKGEYCGSIVYRSKRHVVQDIGRATAVIHDVKDLPASIDSVVIGSPSMKLKYHYGTAALIVRPGRLLTHDVER